MFDQVLRQPFSPRTDSGIPSWAADILKQPFKPQTGSGIPYADRAPDFRGRLLRPLSPKDAARLARGLRPPWTVLAQAAAEAYYDRLRERDRAKLRIYRGRMLPGFDVKVDCGRPEDYFTTWGGLGCPDNAVAPEVWDPNSNVAWSQWRIPGAEPYVRLSKYYERQPGVTGPIYPVAAYAMRDPLVGTFPEPDPHSLPEPQRRTRAQVSPWPQPEPLPGTYFDPLLLPLMTAPRPEDVFEVLQDPRVRPIVMPNASPEMGPPDPPDRPRDAPPPRGMKEIKLKWLPLFVLKRHFNAITELRDLIHAVWGALPAQCKKHRPPDPNKKKGKPRFKKVPGLKQETVGRRRLVTPQGGLIDIMNCPIVWDWGGYDPDAIWFDRYGDKQVGLSNQQFWDNALENIVTETFQDYMLGKFGRKGAEAAAVSRPHGDVPVGLQWGSGYR